MQLWTGYLQTIRYLRASPFLQTKH